MIIHVPYFWLLIARIRSSLFLFLFTLLSFINVCVISRLPMCSSLSCPIRSCFVTWAITIFIYSVKYCLFGGRFRRCSFLAITSAILPFISFASLVSLLESFIATFMMTCCYCSCTFTYLSCVLSRFIIGIIAFFTEGLYSS